MNNELKARDEQPLKEWLCEIAHDEGMPATDEQRNAARTLMTMFGWTVCAMCSRPANGSIAFGLVDVCSAECGDDYVASK